SISVDHEDLSVIGCACLVTTPIPEVLTYFRSPRRSQPVWELHLAAVRHIDLEALQPSISRLAKAK
ncbi:hypothetical protein, partial [Mycobacteroides abscessus]|uniref:hypothetical protein n=1 Tax=Mycobacteroides abscessus TaxID=36809 RepID=UPI001A99D5C3